jgi:diadenosine tetraphosphate (Ap4A) HIT family hydrolase
MAELKIYEDDVCVAFLADAALGHIRVAAKKKAREMHELEPKEVAHLFRVANYASTVIFETLQLHGTNILVNTLNPQFMIDVVPRKQDDGIDLNWERKPMGQEELAQVEKQIKDKTDFIGVAKPSAEVKEAKKEEIKEEEGVVNYLLKQLERVP